LVRTKFLALLLGPFGLGFASLYSGFLNMAGTVATMGLGTVGTRQIAEAYGNEDPHILVVVRRAMFWGTAFLSLSAMLVIWLMRGFLANHVLGSASLSHAIGWLAVGVGFLVAAASQSALLQGTYRVGDLARVTVYGSLFNAGLGILLLWRWNMNGLIGYVLVGPIATFVLGHFYVARLPKIKDDTTHLREIMREWRDLLRMGVAYVGAGLATTFTQLWIRIFVGQSLGNAPLGQYQAAWTVSMYYVSFVLTAMATDYYPRLTGVIHDHEAARRLVNEQTEVALLLSTPIFVAMMATAPWAMHLLYSALFGPSIAILRWQILGDVLKVASWPLGFVILAAGDGKTFFWSECLINLLTAVLIESLLPSAGLSITGVAYLLSYGAYLPLVYWLARRRIGFQWSRAVRRLIEMAFGTCAVVWILAALGNWGAVVGCAAAIWFGIFSVGRLSHMGSIGGPAGRIGEIARRFTFGRPG
jgi:PST family polysaccharide transporter